MCDKNINVSLYIIKKNVLIQNITCLLKDGKKTIVS